MKLFGAQRRRETAKPLQFLELMKATFDCGRNTKTAMSGCEASGTKFTGSKKGRFSEIYAPVFTVFQDKLLYFIVLTARTAALSFFQNPALDGRSNPHAVVIHI
jgi:hypothetical protein